MAFIIKQDLPDYAPVYNPVEVVVDEPALNTGADFRYIFDVYVTGVSDFIRFKVNKDPVLSYGVLDLSRVLQGFINNFLTEGNLINNGSRHMEQGIREYKIHYGYEYRATPSDPIVEYIDVVIGGLKYVYNSSLPYNEWVDFDFDTYDLSTGGGGLLLTDLTTKYIDYDQQDYTGVVMSDGATYEYSEIKTYNENGVLIDTYQANNLFPPTFLDAKYVSLVTGTWNLNNITGGLTLGTQPIIDSTVKTYTVQALDNTLTPVSNIVTYHIDDCNRFNTKRLLFLNKYGIYEGFNFKLVNTDSIQIERKNFKNNPNRLGASGMTYKKSDKTNQTYYVKYMDKLNLISDWITEEEGIWLKELMVSPNIYLDNGDGTLTSVKDITQKDYKIKRLKTDKLINLTIDITMSNDNYTQTF